MKTALTKLRRIAVLPVMAAALVACDDDDSTGPELGTIVDVATASADVSTLVAAVKAADLVETLSGEGPFTVFAPVNSAFAALGEEKLNILLAEGNKALLAKILTYHVVPGNLQSSSLENGTLTTASGGEITIDVSGDVPTVNGAKITSVDIEASNGVIHLIDGVLTENLDIVDVAVLNGFSTLATLVEQQGLTSTLRGTNSGDGYTVFAPTDAAFAALSSVPSGQALTDVLLYHVVPNTVPSTGLSDGQVVGTALATKSFTVNLGASVTITDGSGATATVTVTDVPAANGVIHVLDTVILPS